MANTTKISKYRLGAPRFGLDPNEKPANGPVIEYRLPLEEIWEKYGPPKSKGVNQMAGKKKVVEDWDWVVPFRCGDPRKLLKIKDKGVSLSAAAIKELQPAEFVKIGISKDGVLALAPASDHMEGYKLSRKTNGGHVLGGSKLIKFLTGHGFRPGEYELEKNENGWLVVANAAKRRS